MTSTLFPCTINRSCDLRARFIPTFLLHKRDSFEGFENHLQFYLNASTRSLANG
jgi:hypothetical protein